MNMQRTLAAKSHVSSPAIDAVAAVIDKAEGLEDAVAPRQDYTSRALSSEDCRKHISAFYGPAHVSFSSSVSLSPPPFSFML
jgi:hypothetical protein